MVRNLQIVGMISFGIMVAAIPAYAADPSPAARPATVAQFSTRSTEIGTLLDNPATRTILDKHLPGLAGNPQIEMARSMTLKQIQSYSGDVVTDAVLARIDADLAALPPQ
ncbi:hypothetical protein [Sphingomonas sp. LaA6.9]|uniref:hypothetical protein n=1 Tax=Sphingomonas sp. LaA6.9 TaxID=2919914 RepID=UPI001F4F9EC2|nr:hypothetical protein [Sphingomonas sp. LaA6.9]MCJ8156603.1 hypothetical protein [Sphingomonas sp. LaA6.9]